MPHYTLHYFYQISRKILDCERKHIDKMNKTLLCEKIAVLDKELSFQIFSSVNLRKRPRRILYLPSVCKIEKINEENKYGVAY